MVKGTFSARPATASGRDPAVAAAIQKLHPTNSQVGRDKGGKLLRLNIASPTQNRCHFSTVKYWNLKGP